MTGPPPGRDAVARPCQAGDRFALGAWSRQHDRRGQPCSGCTAKAMPLAASRTRPSMTGMGPEVRRGEGGNVASEGRTPCLLRFRGNRIHEKASCWITEIKVGSVCRRQIGPPMALAVLSFTVNQVRWLSAIDADRRGGASLRFASLASPFGVSLARQGGRRCVGGFPPLRVRAGYGGGGVGRRSDALAVTIARNTCRKSLKTLIPPPGPLSRPDPRA